MFAFSIAAIAIAAVILIVLDHHAKRQAMVPTRFPRKRLGVDNEGEWADEFDWEWPK